MTLGYLLLTAGLTSLSGPVIYFNRKKLKPGMETLAMVAICIVTLLTFAAIWMIIPTTIVLT